MVALQRHGPGNGAPLLRTRATTAAASSRRHDGLATGGRHRSLDRRRGGDDGPQHVRGGLQAGPSRAGAVRTAVLLALLVYAYSHGVRSSRAIERLCGRDAGYRFIVGDAVPDHTVIARFRQRHVAHMREVFVAVLRLCREAGLVRLGLVALDGTKVRANAALDANRTAAS